MYNDLSSEELREAKRFDKEVTEKYKSDSDLLIEPIHWTKFDTNKRIAHPYGYMVQSVGNLTGKRVLEIGCGTGVFSVILAKRGAEFVQAFDISKESINLARKRARINSVDDRVRFQTMTVYDMDYGEEQFDLIVGLNILHHVDIDKVVGKIYSCLKKGGAAYFTEPFGEVEWLERIRLLIPIKVDEEDKSHWQEKLRYKDIRKFDVQFNSVRCIEFHLLSRLDRVIRWSLLVDLLGRIDESLLGRFRFLRKYARRVVIVVMK